MSNITQIETHITLCNIDIAIRQEFKGTPTEMWGAMRYCHPVTIIVKDQWQQTFEFYGSVSDYRAQIDVISESDLISAFECFVSDAIVGTLDCKAFFEGFEYEPCEGIKVLDGCKKSLHKLNELGISNDMLCDMSNELEEYITSRSD